MKKTEITISCDGCGEIILETQGMPGYYLNMNATEYSTYPCNFHYAVIIYPPLERDMQFHNKDCLKQWVNK